MSKLQQGLYKDPLQTLAVEVGSMLLKVGLMILSPLGSSSKFLGILMDGRKLVKRWTIRGGLGLEMALPRWWQLEKEREHESGKPIAGRGMLIECPSIRGF
jgi:hypothetical protein